MNIHVHIRVLYRYKGYTTFFMSTLKAPITMKEISIKGKQSKIALAGTPKDTRPYLTPRCAMQVS
jgi:hypothetical protein